MKKKSNIIAKVRRYGSNPLLLFEKASRYGAFNWLSDELYLKSLYYVFFHKKLDLDDPKTFNEKLQWLKINDRKSIYTTMVDKYEVKEYVAKIIGEEYIIPTLGVWDSFEEIDFDSLPEKFVLKCTHDSGSGMIILDKNKFNKNAAGKQFKKLLNRNFYYLGREWPYKNVKPRIIAERYMTNVSAANSSGEELTDYKVWCFNGQPYWIECMVGRHTNHLRQRFYDKDWNPQRFTHKKIPLTTYSISKPECLDELLELSKKLSQGIPFLRCDFYIVDNKNIKFGEMTFYPAGGGEEEQWNIETMDRDLGDLLELPEWPGDAK